MYEFKKPRNPAEKTVVEEEKKIVEDLDSDNEFFFDPDENLEIEPPNKKQRLQNDSSHLTKRYKGPVKKAPRRPLGKMNEHKEDRMNVSDGEFDPDDPDALAF